MILELKNVSFTYHSKDNETKAVDKMSFGVEEGTFVGLVGPSGCGKTTLLNLLAGITEPGEGEILLHGKKLSKTDDKIALMPQRDQLFEWRTIEKNVCLGPEIQKRKAIRHRAPDGTRSRLQADKSGVPWNRQRRRPVASHPVSSRRDGQSGDCGDERSRAPSGCHSG